MNARTETEAMLGADASVAQLRVPPHSVECETAILGAILLDNAVFDVVGDLVCATDFYHFENREVFEVIAELVLANKPADVFTVHARLEAKGHSKDIGLVYLGELAQYIPSAGNLRRYAEIVRERSLLRRLIAVADETAAEAFNPQAGADAAIDAAAQRIVALRDDAPRDEWIPAVDGMVEHTAILEKRAEGQLLSWPTGLYGLDEPLDGGLRPGSLVVIGARPSMGKTALGMTIGLHMASTYSVALMSMEMAHRDVRDRMISMLGRVPLSEVIRPNREQGLDWSRVSDGIECAKSLRFFVSDQSALTINHVRSKARKLHRQRGLQVLIVDYLGLMVGADPKQPRAYQIEDITKGLKQLAKDLNIVVISLAQLNRQIEQRANRRPMLGDFRDSGSIEQDADIVMGLHRESMDNPELKGDWVNYAELTILKNRQGRTGRVHLHYEGQYVRFTDWGGPVPQRSALRRSAGDEL